MGVITSRIRIPFFWTKSPDVYRKELEDINKEILELEQGRAKLRYQYTAILDLIATYSKLLYVLVALVFFFSALPSTFLEYVFFCGPLIIFHLLVYALKVGVKWYYEYEIARNVDKVKKLNFKKKVILSKVKETAQFKEAKEIIAEYEQQKSVLNHDLKHVQRIHKRPVNQYFENVVSYVLGEQKKNSLICSHCKWHNGMALEEECDYIGFRCCHCFRMNPPRKRRRPDKES